MTATVVVLVKSGVDDSGAVEAVMGKDGNDVSDVALTADGLGGVIAIRNKVTMTLKIPIANVAISINPVAEFSLFPAHFAHVFFVL